MKISTRDLEKLGFKRNEVSAEESGDYPFFYYSFDSHSIYLITDEIIDEDEIKVYLMDSKNYFDDIQALKIFIYSLDAIKLQ